MCSHLKNDYRIRVVLGPTMDPGVSFVFNILAPKLSNSTLRVDTRSLPTRSVARPGAAVLSPLSEVWVVHRILNAENDRA